MDALDLAAAMPDPRDFPALTAAAAADAPLYRLAGQSLAAATRQVSDAIDADLVGALGARLTSRNPPLSGVIDGAPSVEVARHLSRLLDRATAGDDGEGNVAVTVFALPLVLVAGIESDQGEARLTGLLPDLARIAELLREHGAINGSQAFGLAGALVGADALDLAHLHEWIAWQRLPDAAGGAGPERLVRPRPVHFAAGTESVHLRFIVGSTLARRGADLFAARGTGGWGLPMTRELARQLGSGACTVLALPRAPRRPLAAVDDGRSAQREVSAQLFASNAIRRLRASVGEPCAVVSAHRAADARMHGELRISISSPFEPRDAEGFRCPLFAHERVGDVAAMLVRLLADCRVTDIRLLDGVHGDRVPGSTHPLLFKPETIPAGAQLRRH